MRRQLTIIDIVASTLEPFLDLIPRPSAIVTNQIRDVLNNKESRLVELQDRDDVINEVAPLGTFESSLIASL